MRPTQAQGSRFGGLDHGASATAQRTTLHLTHSAVSDQIRLLHEELGVALFERTGRGLKLAPAGARYAHGLERAFAEIREATEVLLHNAHERPLRVSSMPLLAANWLLPRLGDFISTHPEINVDVQSTCRLADVKGGEVDVALRFGRGGNTAVHCELLMRDWHFPVCSPAFAGRRRLVPPKRRTSNDLRKRVADFAQRLDQIPLLRSADEPWSPWFTAAGVAGREPVRGPPFDDSSLMLLAAAAEQGICLGRHAITMDEIATGRLMRLFAAVIEAPQAYYFVCRAADLATPVVTALLDWRRLRQAPRRSRDKQSPDTGATARGAAPHGPQNTRAS